MSLKQFETQSKPLYQEDYFIDFIKNSRDLRLVDKVGILQHAADECFIQDNNLKYLEFKLAIKELKEKQDE